MDEYSKELLKRNLEVSEEILRILKKMNRARVAGRIFKIFKWIVLIGISVWLYYYIEPYLKGLLDTLNSVNAGMKQIQQVGESVNPNNLSSDLLEKLKNLLP